ncbi:GroES-like protein [Irpex lacteus]|nr:GroES-like protein [Irpex lacteus]
MPTHKALFLLEKYGEFVVGDVETYKPGPGELLVEIKATGLNPLDWKIQQVGIFVSEYPAILGTDAAGVVKEVGEGVEGFTVGDRILWEGHFINPNATFQQYGIVPADIAAKLPQNLAFEEGSTLPNAFITAAFGMYSGQVNSGGLRGAGLRGAQLTPFWEEGGRGKYSGHPILVIGGASAVGQSIIQVAKISGFRPIITTASLRNADFLKSLGATHVIDRNLPLGDAVKSITTEPIKYVYDAISTKDTQQPSYDVLAPGGKLIIVLHPALDKSKIDDSKTVVEAFGAVYDPAQRELGATVFKHFTSLLESGEIKPNNVEVVSNDLAGIPEGLERLKANKVSASKLVALPWA